VCSKTTGATYGRCATGGGGGTSQCSVAGVVCGGVLADGGTLNDSGLPSCGGNCCSRACAPYAPTGVLVCQPPSGCRPTGEVCFTDSDCCGYGGIQGQTGVGNCSKANVNDPTGRCDNGNSCRPAGAICKLKNDSCNAENNCCAGNVNQNQYVCQQDNLGIPRCTMAGQACNDAASYQGMPCATSADCCGLSCVPNPNYPGLNDAGISAFICGAVCVARGGQCTTTADCCPGLPCYFPPGSTIGTCDNPPPPPPPDAGADGGMDATVDADMDAAVDAGMDAPADAPSEAPPPCSLYGQVCSATQTCCNGIPCINGRCLNP
jgi:hypothetical protein